MSNENYTLTNDGGVVRASDGAYIPADTGNRDWRDFLAWKDAGGTPAAAPVPAAPVPSCQLWQLQAVMTADQWTQVQAAIAAMNNPTLTAFFQHGTNMIPANSTTLLQLGEGLSLSADQVTALVEQASTVAIP